MKNPVSAFVKADQQALLFELGQSFFDAGLTMAAEFAGDFASGFRLLAVGKNFGAKQINTGRQSFARLHPGRARVPGDGLFAGGKAEFVLMPCQKSTQFRENHAATAVRAVAMNDIYYAQIRPAHLRVVKTDKGFQCFGRLKAM